MKRILISALGLAVSVGFASRASATLLAYEPFTNGVGTAVIGSSGGYGFANAWQANGSAASTTGTNLGYGLTYSDGVNLLQTSGGAAFFQGAPGGNSSYQANRLTAFSRGTNSAASSGGVGNVDGTTTWVSFLSVRQGPTGTVVANPFGRGVNLTLDNTNYALGGAVLQKMAVGNGSGASQNTVGLIPIGAGGNLKPSTATFGSAGGTITNLIVMAIEHVAGSAFDNAYLWVNPTSGAGLALGGADPGFGTAATNSLNTFDYSFDIVRFFIGGQANAAQPYGQLIVSDYRIGESWADVTPIAVPEPATACLVGFGLLSLVVFRRRA